MEIFFVTRIISFVADFLKLTRNHRFFEHDENLIMIDKSTVEFTSEIFMVGSGRVEWSELTDLAAYW
jgi:hypothetical protein